MYQDDGDTARPLPPLQIGSRYDQPITGAPLVSGRSVSAGQSRSVTEHLLSHSSQHPPSSDRQANKKGREPQDAAHAFLAPRPLNRPTWILPTTATLPIGEAGGAASVMGRVDDRYLDGPPALPRPLLPPPLIHAGTGRSTSNPMDPATYQSFIGWLTHNNSGARAAGEDAIKSYASMPGAVLMCVAAMVNIRVGTMSFVQTRQFVVNRPDVFRQAVVQHDEVVQAAWRDFIAFLGVGADVAITVCPSLPPTGVQPKTSTSQQRPIPAAPYRQQQPQLQDDALTPPHYWNVAGSSSCILSHRVLVGLGAYIRTQREKIGDRTVMLYSTRPAQSLLYYLASQGETPRVSLSAGELVELLSMEAMREDMWRWVISEKGGPAPRVGWTHLLEWLGFLYKGAPKGPEVLPKKHKLSKQWVGDGPLGTEDEDDDPPTALRVFGASMQTRHDGPLGAVEACAPLVAIVRVIVQVGGEAVRSMKVEELKQVFTSREAEVREAVEAYSDKKAAEKGCALLAAFLGASQASIKPGGSAGVDADDDQAVPSSRKRPRGSAVVDTHARFSGALSGPLRTELRDWLLESTNMAGRTAREHVKRISEYVERLAELRRRAAEEFEDGQLEEEGGRDDDGVFTSWQDVVTLLDDVPESETSDQAILRTSKFLAEFLQSFSGDEHVERRAASDDDNEETGLTSVLMEELMQWLIDTERASGVSAFRRAAAASKALSQDGHEPLKAWVQVAKVVKERCGEIKETEGDDEDVLGLQDLKDFLSSHALWAEGPAVVTFAEEIKDTMVKCLLETRGVSVDTARSYTVNLLAFLRRAFEEIDRDGGPVAGWEDFIPRVQKHQKPLEAMLRVQNNHVRCAMPRLLDIINNQSYRKYVGGRPCEVLPYSLAAALGRDAADVDAVLSAMIDACELPRRRIREGRVMHFLKRCETAGQPDIHNVRNQILNVDGGGAGAGHSLGLDVTLEDEPLAVEDMFEIEAQEEDEVDEELVCMPKTKPGAKVSGQSKKRCRPTTATEQKQQRPHKRGKPETLSPYIRPHTTARAFSDELLKELIDFFAKQEGVVPPPSVEEADGSECTTVRDMLRRLEGDVAQLLASRGLKSEVGTASGLFETKEGLCAFLRRRPPGTSIMSDQYAWRLLCKFAEVRFAEAKREPIAPPTTHAPSSSPKQKPDRLEESATPDSQAVKPKLELRGGGDGRLRAVGMDDGGGLEARKLTTDVKKAYKRWLKANKSGLSKHTRGLFTSLVCETFNRAAPALAGPQALETLEQVCGFAKTHAAALQALVDSLPSYSSSVSWSHFLAFTGVTKTTEGSCVSTSPDTLTQSGASPNVETPPRKRVRFKSSCNRQPQARALRSSSSRPGATPAVALPNTVKKPRGGSRRQV